MLEIVEAECWRLESLSGDYLYLSVSLTPWAVSAAVLRDGGAVTRLNCVVSCYQPQSFSGDTFLMFYLRARVETRVAKYIRQSQPGTTGNKVSPPSAAVIEKMKDYFSFLFN